MWTYFILTKLPDFGDPHKILDLDETVQREVSEKKFIPLAIYLKKPGVLSYEGDGTPIGYVLLDILSISPEWQVLTKTRKNLLRMYLKVILKEAVNKNKNYTMEGN